MIGGEMATYADILASLKTALSNWSGTPVVELDEGGRRVKYSTPDELVDAIERIQRLADREAASPAAGGKGFKISRVISGGMQ